MDNPEPAPDYRELATAIVDIAEHIRRTTHEAIGYQPLPNGMLAILRAVEDHPGITVAELAARLDRQFSNVSTQLKGLVARGLVTRRRSADDKRFVSLTATDEAHRIKVLFESSWAAALESAAQQLPPGERDRLRDAGPTLAHLASRLTRT